MKITYKEKVEVLMKCLNGAVKLDEKTQKAVYSALVDGFLRIVQAEGLQQQAEEILHPTRCPDCGEIMCPGSICDCHRMHFDVEMIEQGYGLWSRGGFENRTGKGRFLIAASPEGDALPEVARMQELNGRHALNVIYPGCYIFQATCPYTPVIIVGVYRVLSINRNALKAVCERVNEEEWQQDRALNAVADVAREGCITPYNKCNHYQWRVRNE